MFNMQFISDYVRGDSFFFHTHLLPGTWSPAVGPAPLDNNNWGQLFTVDSTCNIEETGDIDG